MCFLCYQWSCERGWRTFYSWLSHLLNVTCVRASSTPCLGPHGTPRNWCGRPACKGREGPKRRVIKPCTWFIRHWKTNNLWKGKARQTPQEKSCGPAGAAVMALLSIFNHTQAQRGVQHGRTISKVRHGRNFSAVFFIRLDTENGFAKPSKRSREAVSPAKAEDVS